MVNNKLECPVCGLSGIEGKDFVVSNQRTGLDNNHYNLYRCKCSFKFWYPFAQINRDFFEKNYNDHSDLKSKPSLGENHKLVLSYLPINSGRALDIGCGDKLLLPTLSSKGFDVWGVDFNRRVIEKNKIIFGLKNLYALSIYEFASLANLPKFDVITFLEVLEHVEPGRFITTIRKLINRNGYIALSIPDSDMFGIYEREVNSPPYHTAYWNPGILRLFLENNGFKVLKIKKIGRVDFRSFFMNTMINLKLIRFKCGVNSSGYFEKSINANAGVKKIIKSTLQLVTFPLRQFLYYLGFRPNIFVLAQAKD
jgi:2-polyprenyl-3-methyl-5-hydroxy-6-metoxy-1,4-benzoquinol methylase